jgi:hypothetical protein
VNKPYPALCRDCAHQSPEPGSPWNSRCSHPIVNAKDAWALSNTGGQGELATSNCRSERARKWFAPCGMAGKLWEPKL